MKPVVNLVGFVGELVSRLISCIIQLLWLVKNLSLTFQPVTSRCWCVDIQVQAILTLMVKITNQVLQIIEPSHSHVIKGLLGVIQVWQDLRTYWWELCNLPHVGPWLW